MEVRHFCIAELQHGVVQRISNVWVSKGDHAQPAIAEEQTSGGQEVLALEEISICTGTRYGEAIHRSTR